MREPGRCQFCREMAPLCSSHIVTEYMYRSMYQQRRMVGFSQTPRGIRQTFLQKGHREYLCCGKCEKLFNDRCEKPSEHIWEALVTRAPSRQIAIERRADPNGLTGLQFTGIDYASFKLFLLLNIWRASVARKHEYSVVNLGPHEDAIREMILNGDAGDEAIYPISVTLLDNGLSILSQFAEIRRESYRAYQIIAGSVAVTCTISSNVSSEFAEGLSSWSQGVLHAPIMLAQDFSLYREVLESIKEISARRKVHSRHRQSSRRLKASHPGLPGK